MPFDPIFLQGEFIFGDTSGRLSGSAVGGDQAVGDPGSGFPDAITVVGDAAAILGRAQGGDDEVASFGVTAQAFGDAFTFAGQARGGDDVVHASAQSTAWAYGDALTISGAAAGGDDSVSAGGTSVRVYGDAERIGGNGSGGDDTIAGGTAFIGTSRFYGDAERLEGSASGGDDLLIAPLTAALLWGDAAYVGPGASTGADRFVFAFPNLADTIMDFEPGKDVIELVGSGLSGFQELASLFIKEPDGVRIFFEGPAPGFEGSIVLQNVSAEQLSERDFLIA